MKILWQKHLISLSFLLFLLTLFRPETIILAWLVLYFSFRYLKNTFEEYVKKGLIYLLPQGLKQQLLTRSLFDFLCDVWFTERTSLLKVIFKPLFTHVEPDNAVDVLNDLQPQLKKKLLTKGIIRILPENWQKVIAPNLQPLFTKQSEEQEELQLQVDVKRKQFTFGKISTDDSKFVKEEFRPKRTSSILIHRKFKDEEGSANQQSSSSKQIQLKKVKSKKKQPKWDRLEGYKGLSKQFQQQGFIGTAKGALEMVKKIVQLNNFPTRLQNVSSWRIFQITLVFWGLIIIQVKLSPHARRLIFKTMYIMAGLLSVLGATGTTGVLIYKAIKPVKSTKQQDLNSREMIE